MIVEGPPLESLLHRLAETPQDFLSEPRIGQAGKTYVSAVAGDLCRALRASLTENDLTSFDVTGQDLAAGSNYLRVVLILCWVLFDPWFRAAGSSRRALWNLLASGALELSGQTAALKFVSDPDRREELARFALARLGYRPAGETLAQAQDRLTTLSASERARVLQAARVAEERARAVREALAKQAAAESADKYGRE